MDKALVSDYQWVGSLCKKAGMIDKEIEFYETARDTEVTNQEVRRESMTCSEWIELCGALYPGRDAVFSLCATVITRATRYAL